MNLKNEKDRNSLLSVVLLTMAVVLLGFTVFVVAQTAQAKSENNALTDEDFQQIRPDKEKTQESLLAYREAATVLTAHNMFVPSEDEAEPEADCTAILGDQARIDNRWVKIGDRVGGAEIVALGPTSVTLLWQDRRIIRTPVLREEGRSNNRSSSNRQAQSARLDRAQMERNFAQIAEDHAQMGLDNTRMEEMRSRMRGGRGADMMMGGRGGMMGRGRGGMRGDRGGGRTRDGR